MIPWKAPEALSDWEWEETLQALWDAADAVDDATRETLDHCGDSRLMACLRARARGQNETLSLGEIADDLPHALSGLLSLQSHHLTKSGEGLCEALSAVLITHAIAELLRA